jgi:hypothetical protein
MVWIVKPGLSTERLNAPQLIIFVPVDHHTGGMVLVREFRQAVRESTSAVAHGAKVLHHGLDQRLELRYGISGVKIRPLGPHLFVLLSHGGQPVRDQIVFRIEVTVDGHFVGIGCRSDGLHPDAADALTIKERLRGFDDAFARRRCGSSHVLSRLGLFATTAGWNILAGLLTEIPIGIILHARRYRTVSLRLFRTIRPQADRSSGMTALVIIDLEGHERVLPDREAVRNIYDSAEYQPLKALRLSPFKVFVRQTW